MSDLPVDGFDVEVDREKDVEEMEMGDQVTLTLEDDTELVCDIITVFPCDGVQYIALTPADSDTEGELGDIFLYRFVENGDDIELIDIEDDEEFEKASDAFDELLDTVEFNEMFDGEEEPEA